MATFLPTCSSSSTKCGAYRCIKTHLTHLSSQTVGLMLESLEVGTLTGVTRTRSTAHRPKLILYRSN